MVDKNRNDSSRRKYFLDRRNFAKPTKSTPKTTSKSHVGPMFSMPETNSSQNDQEVESKLKALYDSLNTSFWDTEPKRKKKSDSEQPADNNISLNGRKSVVSFSSISSLLSDFASGLKNTLSGKDYKSLLRQKKIVLPLVGVIALLSVVLVFNGDSNPSSGQIASVKGSSKINYENAGYTPMLPKTVSKRDVAEASLKYEPGKKVFSYNDSLSGGKGIITSQQPLPNEYRQDPISGLTAIASNIGASDWLATSKGKMYYGKNESGDGQFVIFTYKNILMIMRSGTEINPMTWKNYVDNLE